MITVPKPIPTIDSVVYLWLPTYCVWLDYTFPLSYRDIEKMMLYRGIVVTYETIRDWCQKFGQQYANQVRRKRSYVTDKWHLDKMVVTIKKQKYYLWRAVDSEGNVLDVLLKRRRNTEAAKRFFRKLLKKQGFVPRVMGLCRKNWWVVR